MLNIKERELTIWAAQGPGGELVRDSIGTYHSRAKKWTFKKRNYNVIKLGTLKAPIVNSAQAGSIEAVSDKPIPVLVDELATLRMEKRGEKRKRGRPKGSKNKPKMAA